MARIEIEEPQPLSIVFGQAALRVVTGVIMAAHGWQKAIDLPAWQAKVGAIGIPYPEIAAYLSIGAELVGGALLVLGLLTRASAIAVVVNLAVAIGTVHATKGLFAQNGGFEFPLVLLVSALFVFLSGPDTLSADTLLRRRARDRAIQRDEIWSQPPYIEMPEAVLYRDAEERRQAAHGRGRFTSR